MKSYLQRVKLNKICFDFKWKVKSTLISIKISPIFQSTTIHIKMHLFKILNSTLFLFYTINLLLLYLKSQFKSSSAVLRTFSVLQNKKCCHLPHLKWEIKTWENLQGKNQSLYPSHLIRIQRLTYPKALSHHQRSNLLQQFQTSK